jgi:shikimate kinase
VSRSIFLVGFMGSGKSTVGRALAQRLGWEFIDLDERIEAAEGTSISEIFATRGEAEFRRIESAALGEAAAQAEVRPAVIALGGGAFAQPGNVELIARTGVSIWLDCPLEVARRRVEHAIHRPLARDPLKFEQLYHARRDAYSKADFRVPILDDDASAAVEAILKLPLFS